MKHDKHEAMNLAQNSSKVEDLPSAPNTLEGYHVLHQFFRIRRRQWNALPDSRREKIVEKAVALFRAMGSREDGESAIFTQLGHKGDLIAIHFRRNLDDLAQAQLEVGRLSIARFLEQTGSYLSVIEIGLYEASVKLYAELAAKNVKPYSPEWKQAVEAELANQRNKLGARLWPKIPARPYVCFYPMNKRRAGADNWYMLPIKERQRLMHDHGMVGRRYAGHVTQIISGSVGFDDWEWGVDLFADDPLVFKKLVYEMRFDESSARYAEFGSFYVGIRVKPDQLPNLLAVPSEG